ncbi:MAG TPA: hypothetical protein VHY22_04950 [Chthoniobacteraceae bacterium]|jgi:type II secretory pathway pseudopilin PulG|nr:hypothetical protein [Chthoniobacteraceae bacterium]
MSASSTPASRATESQPRGFTILELLVSIATLVILFLILAHALTQTSNIWTFGRANSDNLENMRAIGDSVANDLRAALLPLDRTMATGTNLQFLVNPAGITAAKFNNPDAAFWQAPVAVDTSLGDAAEVGYFVKWDTAVNPGDPETNPQNPKAALCRFLINPGAAGVSNSNYLIYSTPAAWLSDNIIQSVAPGSSAQSYQGLFAENVIGLWVRCLDAYGQPITKTFAGAAYANHAYDSRLGYMDSSGTTSASFIDSAGQAAPLCALPPVVEVSIAMIDSHAASKVTPAVMSAIVSLEGRLSTSPAANADGFVSAVLASPAASGLQSIMANLRSYQTRVYIMGSK